MVSKKKNKPRYGGDRSFEESFSFNLGGSPKKMQLTKATKNAKYKADMKSIKGKFTNTYQSTMDKMSKSFFQSMTRNVAMKFTGGRITAAVASDAFAKAVADIPFATGDLYTHVKKYWSKVESLHVKFGTHVIVAAEGGYLSQFSEAQSMAMSESNMSTCKVSFHTGLRLFLIVDVVADDCEPFIEKTT